MKMQTRNNNSYLIVSNGKKTIAENKIQIKKYSVPHEGCLLHIIKYDQFLVDMNSNIPFFTQYRNIDMKSH